MKALPHQYEVQSEGTPESCLKTYAVNLPTLTVAPPENFGGPGDQWSPEDLLMASVANCLILSFRAIAKASKLEWCSIECKAQGTLDKEDRKIKFTHITTKAKLTIQSSESAEKANKLLHKAEESCLVSNSLSAKLHFECEILVDNS